MSSEANSKVNLDSIGPSAGFASSTFRSGAERVLHTVHSNCCDVGNETDLS